VSKDIFEVHAVRILALSDTLTVSLAAFQLVFSALVSVVLFRLAAWQRRYEGLDERLNDATTRLVDERFRAASLEIGARVQGFLVVLDELKQRIQSGDDEVRGLGERDQRIELALATRVDGLKDYIRDHAANKADLEKHETAVDRRLAQVEEKIGGLGRAVAVLGERVK
jgi:hypothetical protein